jgi:hypothetical protein
LEEEHVFMLFWLHMNFSTEMGEAGVSKPAVQSAISLKIQSCMYIEQDKNQKEKLMISKTFSFVIVA